MTREEAIEQLQDAKDGYKEYLSNDAINMAIETLEQEPTTKNDLGVDCISRKAAEDITWQDPSYTDPLNILTEVRDKIRELPSVTPQETRWIPVSERLPEKNMRCLVAVGRFNFTEIATYSDLMGIIDHKIFYQGDVGHDNFKNITQYVKAWMPLPLPWE